LHPVAIPFARDDTAVPAVAEHTNVEKLPEVPLFKSPNDISGTRQARPSAGAAPGPHVIALFQRLLAFIPKNPPVDSPTPAAPPECRRMGPCDQQTPGSSRGPCRRSTPYRAVRPI